MLKTLQEKLHYKFKDEKLLLEALTHKSFKQPYNNERLEFLGDAVLDVIVAEYLYFKFPKENEGVLSKIRASLVNEEGFTRLAKYIGLGEYLYISSAEENNNGRTKPSLLSNAFEALMGAIYLESGLKEVEKIIIKMLEENYPTIDLNSLFKDFKTTLQELTQAIYGTTPNYKLINSSGPDHKKEFEISVEIDDEQYATAYGHSKKHAQQEAAKVALKILQAKIDE